MPSTKPTARLSTLKASPAMSIRPVGPVPGAACSSLSAAPDVTSLDDGIQAGYDHQPGADAVCCKAQRGSQAMAQQQADDGIAVSKSRRSRPPAAVFASRPLAPMPTEAAKLDMPKDSATSSRATMAERHLRSCAARSGPGLWPAPSGPLGCWRARQLHLSCCCWW